MQSRKKQACNEPAKEAYPKPKRRRRDVRRQRRHRMCSRRRLSLSGSPHRFSELWARWIMLGLGCILHLNWFTGPSHSIPPGVLICTSCMIHVERFTFVWISVCLTNKIFINYYLRSLNFTYINFYTSSHGKKILIFIFYLHNMRLY